MLLTTGNHLGSWLKAKPTYLTLSPTEGQLSHILLSCCSNPNVIATGTFCSHSSMMFFHVNSKHFPLHSLPLLSETCISNPYPFVLSRAHSLQTSLLSHLDNCFHKGCLRRPLNPVSVLSADSFSLSLCSSLQCLAPDQRFPHFPYSKSLLWIPHFIDWMLQIHKVIWRAGPQSKRSLQAQLCYQSTGLEWAFAISFWVTLSFCSVPYFLLSQKTYPQVILAVSLLPHHLDEVPRNGQELSMSGLVLQGHFDRWQEVAWGAGGAYLRKHGGPSGWVEHRFHLKQNKTKHNNKKKKKTKQKKEA